MEKLPKINILYEDNHLLVVIKPKNIPVQKDKSNDTDLLSILKDYLKEKYHKNGDAYLGLVHRLDRPVSGIMVFAKTSKSAKRLSEQIRNRSFKKTSKAIVHGLLKNKKGTLKNYLLKDEGKNKSFAVQEGTKNAKLAVLDYEVISENKADNTSIVEVELHTGRHHQIRLQFANIGHPLVGDSKYGKDKGLSNVALWSYKLKFKHPTKDEEMEFTLEPKM